MKTESGYLICKECQDGFYQGVDLYGAPSNLGCVESCSDVHENCIKCSSDGSSCSECSDGFVINQSGSSCVEAIDHCDEVSENGLVCENCSNGFYWDGEVCYACEIDNCKECKGEDDDNECTQCNPDFVYDHLKNECIPPFEFCEVPLNV